MVYSAGECECAFPLPVNSEIINKITDAKGEFQEAKKHSPSAGVLLGSTVRQHWGSYFMSSRKIGFQCTPINILLIGVSSL